MDLALNNLQMLMCHKIQPTKLNQTRQFRVLILVEELYLLMTLYLRWGQLAC